MALFGWRAGLLALERGSSAPAAEALASGLDFLQAFDDGSMAARSVRLLGVESIVEGARRLLETPGLDPIRLQAALEPRLARAKRR
jgi:hypothetical protein